MRIIRTFVACIAVILAGALPSMAAEPTAPAAPQASPAASAPGQPSELPWLLPEPILAAAQKPGPCTVSISCRYGSAVSCSGTVECEWQYDTQWVRGYVYCENSGGSWVRYYCPLATE